MLMRSGMRGNSVFAAHVEGARLGAIFRGMRGTMDGDHGWGSVMAMMGRLSMSVFGGERTTTDQEDSVLYKPGENQSAPGFGACWWSKGRPWECQRALKWRTRLSHDAGKWALI